MKKLTPRQYAILLDSIRTAIRKFNCIYHTDFAVEPLPSGCGLCIHLSTKAGRWADKMARRARAAANCGEATIEMRERVTVVSSHKFKTTGIAICSPKDEYDPDLGIAIAYARAMDEVVPNYVL